MERKHLLPLAFAGLAIAVPSVAQAQSDTQDTQVWTTASVNVKLSDKWKLSNEFVARFGDRSNGLYEIENSTLLGYQATKNVSVWAGYLHNPTYSDGDFKALEHRFREQVVVDNIAKVGPATLGARLRTEQRWRDEVDGTAWRMRPYVKLAMPIGGGKLAPALTFSHESFVNLNTTAFQSVSGFDRMRNAAAISVKLNDKMKAEVGYLNQYKFVRNGPDTMDHALTTAVGFSF